MSGKAWNLIEKLLGFLFFLLMAGVFLSPIAGEDFKHLDLAVLIGAVAIVSYLFGKHVGQSDATRKPQASR